MKGHLFGAFGCVCLLAFLASTAPAQIIPIDDIQVYDSECLPDQINGPYWGDVVTVEGLIYVQKGTYNSGSHYIMGDTGGIQFYQPGAPPLELGQRVQVTGTVGAFQGEIQVSSNPTVVPIGDPEPVPEPMPMTVGELLSTCENIGLFVAVSGTATGVNGDDQFFLYDGVDTVQVYIDSTTEITLACVEEGDEYLVISPVVVFNGEIELKPRGQGDLIEDPEAPRVMTFDSANWAPDVGESNWDFLFEVSDQGSIASATMYYRFDEGSWNTMPGNIGSPTDDVFPVMFPGVASLDPVEVEAYFEFLDDEANLAEYPGCGSLTEFSIGYTSIYEVQYVDPDSVSQSSPLEGMSVNVRGIVTAGRGEAGTPSRFVIQEAAPADADDDGVEDYRWGGILVFESVRDVYTFAGDEVRIGGTVDEYFGLTELAPHTSSAIYIESFGNSLPPPMYEHTRVLADDTFDDGNGRLGEAYESCWIRTRACTVLDTLGFGAYIVSDTGARADSCEVEPEVQLTYEPVINDIVILEGFMDYEFGAFQITPTADNYVVVVTGVDDWTPEPLQPAGGFTSIAPNPFNPKTAISFVLTRNNLTQLNVYDIRGNLVTTLVNEMLPAQEHSYYWDGTDFTGQRVSSGTYFARLRIGSEVMQVQKLMMVK